MKITWEFADGTIKTLDVEEKYGNVILESRIEEESGDHYERIHCISLESALYEGLQYADLRTVESEYDNEVLSRQIELVWQLLTPLQRRRMEMYTDGLTEMEIAEIEKVPQQSVSVSIRAARKIFKNFFG